MKRNGLSPFNSGFLDIVWFVMIRVCISELQVKAVWTVIRRDDKWQYGPTLIWDFTRHTRRISFQRFYMSWSLVTLNSKHVVFFCARFRGCRLAGLDILSSEDSQKSHCIGMERFFTYFKSRLFLIAWWNYGLMCGV